MPFIRYKNGYIGAVSENVLRIMLRKPGIIQVSEMPAFQSSIIQQIPGAPELDLTGKGDSSERA